MNQSIFGGGVKKFPFLTTRPRKRAPPKHYKNRGFSKTLLKKICVMKRPFLDKRNPNPEIPDIICCPFFSFSNKNTKILWNLYFCSVLANLKKRTSKNYLSLKNPIFAPFFEKAVFRILADNWAQKTQDDNWTQKIAWNHYKNRQTNKLGPDNNNYLAQIVTPTWPR